MRLTRSLFSFLLVALVGLFVFRPASAGGGLYTPGPNILIPGNPIASNDIAFVDAAIHRLFLADRSNKAIDVVDTSANKFIGNIPVSGPGSPNGVATDPVAHNVFYGNLDSTLHVASSFSLTDIASISTGGTGRVDELAIDPADQLVLEGNDQDSPPFLTLISYAGLPNLSIVGKLKLPQASGIEQPIWDPGQRLFFVSIPKFGSTPAVIGISPTPAPDGTLQLARTYPLPVCTGANGLALGPSEVFFVGCAPAPLFIDGRTGTVLKIVNQADQPDEVWFDAGNRQFLTVSNATGAQNMTVIDAGTLNVTQNLPVGPNHNVTADNTLNSAYVVLRAGNPNCFNGCLAFFPDPLDAAATPVTTASNVSSAASVTTAPSAPAISGIASGPATSSSDPVVTSPPSLVQLAPQSTSLFAITPSTESEAAGLCVNPFGLASSASAGCLSSALGGSVAAWISPFGPAKPTTSTSHPATASHTSGRYCTDSSSNQEYIDYGAPVPDGFTCPD